MNSLSSVNKKLNHLKNKFQDDVSVVYVFIGNEMPIQVQLIFNGGFKAIHCNSIESYFELMKRYENIPRKIFLGVKKASAEDVKIAMD